MLVKRNFNPIKIWGYIKKQMIPILLWTFAVCFAPLVVPSLQLALPFAPVAALGSALAIFVAFRNNSAYGRWWEARQIWGGIVNSSRVFARLVITFSNSHSHQENYNAARSNDFKERMVLRAIAWVHALRIHLRNGEQWHELQPFLSPEEYHAVLNAQNRPNYLQLLQGEAIYRAMANGTLGGFDSFQMEGQLLALANYQGAAERIKNTPLPKQYDYFTRLFVLLFAILLPFGLFSLFSLSPLAQSALVFILATLLSAVFVIMERTGAANEDPFEDRITDVPLSSLCNTIERDLKEMLGRTDLPPKMTATNGYLS